MSTKANLNNFRSRDIRIDLCKSILIVLVILGHAASVPAPLRVLIYSFHMPAFFCVYGYTYNRVKHEASGFITGNFVKSKIHRLLLPYFIWAIMYSPLTLINILYILYGSQNALRHASGLTSLWFLPCMFLAVILYELMNWILKYTNLFKTEWAADLTIVLLSTAASYLLPRLSFSYPWSLDVSLMACGFIGIGHLFSKGRKYCTNIWICIALLLCTLSILYVTVPINLELVGASNVDMASSHYGNYFLFLLDGICGFVFIFQISEILANFYLFRVVSMVGKHTISIFALHKLFLFSTEKIVGTIFANTLNAFFSTIATLIISFLIAILIDDYAISIAVDGVRNKQRMLDSKSIQKDKLSK